MPPCLQMHGGLHLADAGRRQDAPSPAGQRSRLHIVHASAAGAEARIDDCTAAAKPATEATPLWRGPGHFDRACLTYNTATDAVQARPTMIVKIAQRTRIRKRNPIHCTNCAVLRFRNGLPYIVQLFLDRVRDHTSCIESCCRSDGCGGAGLRKCRGGGHARTASAL